jgi:phage repressor protein C with HTH and peptisase S24 domain
MERAGTIHERLWAAIDTIAARHGLSPSGLARRAGLDATAFNKSKRFTVDGRPRWPSTESIAKILAATGCDLAELVHLIEPPAGLLRPPSVRVEPPAFAGFHDDGAAAGRADGALSFRVVEPGMPPLYRPGDVLVITPSEPPRAGDRVVLRIDDGAFEAWVFLAGDAAAYELASIDDGARRTVAADRVSCLARILWASQ